MIGFSVLAFQLVLWQSADLSVSIVSETDDENREVNISVLNTAGSTLLFYENDQVTGKIEYLSEDGWIEYCDVCYTAGNAQAISPQYGGTFAELAPGEDWNVTIPEDKVAGMQDGTYRIKMTYITEKNYNAYLEEAYRAETSMDESEMSDSDISSDVSNDGSGFINTAGKVEAPKKDKFLAESKSEVFIKTFEYTAPVNASPRSLVREISINDSDISEDITIYESDETVEIEE